MIIILTQQFKLGRSWKLRASTPATYFTREFTIFAFTLMFISLSLRKTVDLRTKCEFKHFQNVLNMAVTLKVMVFSFPLVVWLNKPVIDLITVRSNLTTYSCSRLTSVLLEYPQPRITNQTNKFRGYPFFCVFPTFTAIDSVSNDIFVIRIQLRIVFIAHETVL